MSSTLIAGEEEAILVDALIANDQVDGLAEWVRGFGKRLLAYWNSRFPGELARLQEHPAYGGKRPWPRRMSHRPAVSAAILPDVVAPRERWASLAKRALDGRRSPNRPAPKRTPWRRACIGLGTVGQAHPVPGVGQFCRESESLSGAGRAAGTRACRSQLDRRAVKADWAEGMLDDVGDGTKPDVLPVRRHRPHGGLTKHRTSRPICDQIRIWPCLASSGDRPDLSTSRCAAPVSTAAPPTALSTAAIVLPCPAASSASVQQGK